LQVDGIVGYRNGRSRFDGYAERVLLRVQSHRRGWYVDDAGQVGLLAFVVRVKEDRVLHDVGVDLALEHSIVGFEAGGELDVTDTVALLLQLRRNPGLESVDIGTWNEADLEFGLGGSLAVRGSHRKRADEHESRSEV